MPQCIRAFKCPVQGTPAFVTRNPELGVFVGQESREGYGYTSINATLSETELCSYLEYGSRHYDESSKSTEALDVFQEDGNDRLS